MITVTSSKRRRVVFAALLAAACSGASEAPPTAPPAPTNAPDGSRRPGVAWDPIRQRLVQFGGSTDARTWTYDGTQWTVAAMTGPSARFATAMTWDPVREAVVLFGGVLPRFVPGEKAEYLNDTWTWDGTAWTALELPEDQRPPPCGDAELTWDATLRGPLMFGGSNLNTRFRGTWVLTASAGWAEVPTP